VNANRHTGGMLLLNEGRVRESKIQRTLRKGKKIMNESRRRRVSGAEEYGNDGWEKHS